MLAGESVRCPNAREITYSSQDTDYREYIVSAYNYASQLLLDLFNDRYQLVQRFRYSFSASTL